MTCLAITKREKLYTVDPAVWQWMPHDLAAVCAWNLGLWGIAREQGKLALAFDPEDLRLRRNVELMEMKREDAA
jgi:hypothetical protein